MRFSCAFSLLASALMLCASNPAGGAARKQQVRIKNTWSFSVNVPAAARKYKPTKALLWITRDGGKHWALHAEDPTGKGPLQVKLDKDGRYGVAVGIVTPQGRTLGKPRDGRGPAVVFLVDTTKPRLTFTGPTERTVVRPGGAVVIAWTVSETDLRGVALWALAKGEKPKMLSKPITGASSFSWNVDARSGTEYRVRAVVADRARNKSIADLPVRIVVDGEPPAAKLVSANVTEAGDVEIQYEASDVGAAGLKTVRFFESADGGASWTESGTDEDLASPFSYRTSSEVKQIGLFVAATDGAGNAAPAPMPGDKPMVTAARPIKVVEVVVEVPPPPTPAEVEAARLKELAALRTEAKELLEGGKLAEATEVGRKLATKDADGAGVDVAILHGLLAMQDGDQPPAETRKRLKGALAEFTKLAEAQPKLDRGHYLAGLTYYLLWRLDTNDDQLRAKAAQHLETTTGLEATGEFYLGAAHWYLAMILEHQKRPADAFAHWEQAERTLPAASGHRSAAAKRIAQLRAHLKEE